MKTNNRLLAVAFAAAFAAFSIIPAGAQAPAGKPKAGAAAKPAAAPVGFASPEEAANALVAAVRAGDGKTIARLMGPGSEEWLFTGDTVADKAEWARFIAAYERKNAFERAGDAKATLVIGDDGWPFPAPLVKKGDRWNFDAAAGREEVINRRVGRNELDTIQTLLAAVDAQREYAATDADRNGFGDYARRFISTQGKKDGLYWPTKEGEPQSPLGPLVGEAAREGYGARFRQGQAEPYHGYFYRLLTAQGKDAPGGAYDYVVKDKLLGGFGIVAYPAKYGVSGVMTFIVNHDGVVHEKDLGTGTASAVAKMKLYNPDKSWKKAQQ